ncbi:hypothetical protein K7432_001275 [Basidiobolus ranarum]|uniref:Yeast cell wall synthesis Kre9/Knh1-like N-terminal domain-containing protein n=1 Tax=Basidiobolus ranarum TaxID=34480 RepID=A0ABR2X386_9FUNG
MQLSSLATLLTVVSSIATYVDASPAISSPLGAQWKAGTTNIITWYDNQDGMPYPDKVDLALVQGKASSLQQMGNIATGVDTASGQFKWDIPVSQASGKDYAIQIGISPNITYSPYFEILSDNEESSESVPESTSTSTSISTSTSTSTSTTSSSSSTNSDNSTSEISSSTTAIDSSSISEATSAASTEATSAKSTSSVAESTFIASSTSESTPTPASTSEITSVAQTSSSSSITPDPLQPSHTPTDISGSPAIGISFISTLMVVGCVITQLI